MWKGVSWPSSYSGRSGLPRGEQSPVAAACAVADRTHDRGQETHVREAVRGTELVMPVCWFLCKTFLRAASIAGIEHLSLPSLNSLFQFYRLFSICNAVKFSRKDMYSRAMI